MMLPAEQSCSIDDCMNLMFWQILFFFSVCKALLDQYGQFCGVTGDDSC